MQPNLTDLCIYTIKHSKDLHVVNNKGNPFAEAHPWVTARRLLIKAEADRKRLPVIFCPAESTDYLFAWALLETIENSANGVEYTFSHLTRFKENSIRKSKLKKRNGKALNKNFIRPYAICLTPDFLD